jgi:hypothetical protein
MGNVFRATQKHGGSFQATDMVMRINGNSLASHVVQQINGQYQQQITTLYEIGSNNVYYVGGRAQGNLTIARVAGPQAVPGIILDKFNDICSPGEMALSSGSSSCKNGGQFAAAAASTYTLGGVIITSLGFSTQAQDVVVNEQMGFQFLDMDVSGAGLVPPNLVVE